MQPLLLLFLSPVVVLSSSAWTARGEDEAVAVASPEVNPLYYNCSLSGGRYGQNTTYEDNLKALAARLVGVARVSNFASHTVGSAPDAAYGIALCRGDYTGDECANGLRKAFENAVENRLFCDRFRDATIYYDQYMLRFSGEDFRANLTNAPAWVAWNMNNVTGAGGAAKFGGRRRVQYYRDIRTPTGQWFHVVRAPPCHARYATGEAGFGELDVGETSVGMVEQQCSSSPVMYALVQCTPDLLPADCRSCLAGIASQMPRWFSSNTSYRLGGRILGVRCNLRYEVDRFFLESNETIKIHMPKPKVIQESERQKKLAKLETEIIDEIGPLFSRYTLQQIKEATRDFSNEIGKGGFGHVYKGKLPSGTNVAVKRLAVSSSGQGFDQFMNEIKLMATLQHRNLVRLLGFCIQNEENILIYEYMENGSLDDVFSDPERKSRLLDWSTRLRVIDSIAQGLLYLHRLAKQNTCIVHRDIKANNILLDASMNAKISDFGIAKIFCPNLMESATTKGCGSFGYIAPEVLLTGTFSDKSDVYSLGVLILEIISGTKVNSACFFQQGRSDNLLTCAWQLWDAQRYKDLVDRSLISAGENIEDAVLIRYVQMALLCVQANPEHRPNIDKIVAMLSNTEALDVPKEPPAYYNVQVPTSSNHSGAVTPTVFYTSISS
uniref:Protein kinase domain-containing protein n=2 Tax=Oryza TaxID=4527 RepID=A0A0E0MY72_ORYRU